MAVVTLHVISRRAFLGERPYARWDDPGGLAPMPEAKRAAVIANPLARGDDEPVQILATAGDRVVGRVDLLSGSIDARGVPVRPTATTSSPEPCASS